MLVRTNRGNQISPLHQTGCGSELLRGWGQGILRAISGAIHINDAMVLRLQKTGKDRSPAPVELPAP